MKAMLTRLCIDNFKCFVNFECRFGNNNKHLIMGRNGSGKTSLFEVLLLLREFAVEGQPNNPSLGEPTRWLSKDEQTFEIEASIDGASYIYRLLGVPRGARFLVKTETVQWNRKAILEFVEGQVYLYDDQFGPPTVYPSDPYRSALAAATGNTKLIKFKEWFNGLNCFKLDPFIQRISVTEMPQSKPETDLSNFADWYLFLEGAYPEKKPILFESLSAAMDGFTSLKFTPFERSGNVRLLSAEFDVPGEGSVAFTIKELSDGQRCLIYLYTILHFVVANSGTVVIDEPENFLSLRELQPWLLALEDVLDEGRGQVLLISHHPEFINQWAPKYGIQLLRDGASPVHAQPFVAPPEYALPAAEIVARGWELE